MQPDLDRERHALNHSPTRIQCFDRVATWRGGPELHTIWRNRGLDFLLVDLSLTVHEPHAVDLCRCAGESHDNRPDETMRMTCYLRDDIGWIEVPNVG